ncbi:MAG: hypothetical protein A2Y56_13060 [Candidatus Aminicenantes bacterium RBG_13_63_10]|nr:MAG: hypothetical protein A2Y56_13060 [Candidatus Aminicenantes bacterium RBG_13_63_10]
MKGLSHEVRHKGGVFYVQTQDMGNDAGYVESLIYKGGTLITSRKSYYYSLLGSADLPERVAQLLREQHRSVIRDIEIGRFNYTLTSSEKEGGG